MRIRKTGQVTPSRGSIVDSYNTSTTDGYSANYINNHSVVVSPTEPSTDRKKVWLRHNPNLFNLDNATLNCRLSSYGTNETETGNGYFTSEFIKVSPNTSYIKNSPIENAYHRIAYYSSNNESSFISLTENNVSTTPSTCNYIRICGVMTEMNYTIIQEGTTIISDKEYILNNNNVYEEFINNEPVVLYNNPTGTTGNITLSDSVANYNYIEIYFMDNSGYSRFERYYNVNGKTVDLEILKLNNITNKQLKLTSKNVTISGTSITNGDAIVSYIKLDATVTGDSYATNELSITRVLGYN